MLEIYSPLYNLLSSTNNEKKTGNIEKLNIKSDTISIRIKTLENLKHLMLNTNTKCNSCCIVSGNSVEMLMCRCAYLELVWLKIKRSKIPNPCGNLVCNAYHHGYHFVWNIFSESEQSHSKEYLWMIHGMHLKSQTEPSFAGALVVSVWSVKFEVIVIWCNIIKSSKYVNLTQPKHYIPIRSYSSLLLAAPSSSSILLIDRPERVLTVI